MRRYAEMLAELQPESPVAMEALASLAFADGDYLTAARYCRNLAERGPRPFRKLVQPGRGLSQDGQPPEGRAGIPAGHRAEARFGAGAPEPGRGAPGIERPARGARRYEKALEIDGQPAGRAVEPGAGAGAAGRAESGPRSSTPGFRETAPEWCDATFRLGYLRLLRAEYGSSAEAFRACLAKRPDWPEAHLNAGIAYARSRQSRTKRSASSRRRS